MSSALSRAIVFDMDGVLIDSEPLWRRAEVACFGAVGVELVEADCHQTTGLRIDEAAAWWFERQPWDGPSVEEVAERIIARMVELIEAEGTPMVGASEAVDAAERAGFRVALASSSPMALIAAVLDRFGWADRFEVKRSAESEARGKPHPDVYTSTLRALELAPAQAIAIEDSGNGVRSALAAGLRVLAVPEGGWSDASPFDEATWCYASLRAAAAELASLRTCAEDEAGR